MLFSKKSRKKQKTINLARLSEAISVHNGDISLITYAGGTPHSDEEIERVKDMIETLNEEEYQNNTMYR